MNVNTKCDELRRNITTLVNDSGLPISLVYYMMKDFMSELTSVYNTVLSQIRRDEAEEEKAKQQQQEEIVEESGDSNL